MKSGLLDWLYASALIIIIITILIKLILWSSINKKRRIGFLKTFIVWFSAHDIHNTSSRQSHRFRSSNNIINVIFWVGIILVIVAYVFDTNAVLDTPPSKNVPIKKF